MRAEEKLSQMGHTLPATPLPAANYVTAVRTGALVFLSGHLPKRPDGSLITGKLGQDVTMDQGYEGARFAAVSCLASLKAAIGDLDRVHRVVKVSCMVNCTAEFRDLAPVANGASDLLVELFEEKGRHARVAIGMQSLPMGACIEIDMVVETD